jgi:hypothetical protein
MRSAIGRFSRIPFEAMHIHVLQILPPRDEPTAMLPKEPQQQCLAVATDSVKEQHSRLSGFIVHILVETMYSFGSISKALQRPRSLCNRVVLGFTRLLFRHPGLVCDCRSPFCLVVSRSVTSLSLFSGDPSWHLAVNDVGLGFDEIAGKPYSS